MKRYIALTLLILGMGIIGNVSARHRWHGGQYGYPHYYYDDDAAIAGGIIGGFGNIVGSAVVASEARKTREQEERLAELEDENYYDNK